MFQVSRFRFHVSVFQYFSVSGFTFHVSVFQVSRFNVPVLVDSFLFKTIEFRG